MLTFLNLLNKVQDHDITVAASIFDKLDQTASGMSTCFSVFECVCNCCCSSIFLFILQEKLLFVVGELTSQDVNRYKHEARARDIKRIRSLSSNNMEGGDA